MRRATGIGITARRLIPGPMKCSRNGIGPGISGPWIQAKPWCTVKQLRLGFNPAGQFIFSTWARAQARKPGGGWAPSSQAEKKIKC